MTGTQLTLGEIQNEELLLLKEFDSICKEYDLRYWLAAGSCLGAVRHGGFIPWDDDTDVYMPRPDYERLREISPENEVGFLLADAGFHPWCFGKYVSRRTRFDELYIKAPDQYGVFLDIFPLDGLDDDDPVGPLKKIRGLYRSYHWAYCFDWSRQENRGVRGVAKRLAGAVYRTKSRDDYLDKMRRFSCEHSFNSSQFVATIGSSYSADRDYFDREKFFAGNELCDYAGIVLRIPTNVKAYLEQLYGSTWKTPIKCGQSCHGGAYWR